MESIGAVADADHAGEATLVRRRVETPRLEKQPREASGKDDAHKEGACCPPSGGAAAQASPLWAMKTAMLLHFSATHLLAKYLVYFYTGVGLTSQRVALCSVVNKGAAFAGQVFWPAAATRSGSLGGIAAVAAVLCGATALLFLLPSVQAGMDLALPVVVALHSVNTGGTVLDGLTVQVLGQQTSDAASYADIRLYGTVGAGLGALVAGQLVYALGVNVIFLSNAALSIATALIILLFLPLRSGKKALEGEQAATERRSVQPLLRLFASAEVKWYFANLLIYAVMTALIEDFLAFYLIHDFSSVNPAIFGIMGMVTCISEVFVFKFLHRWLLNQGFSLMNQLAASQLTLALRCVLYMFLPSPWLVLPIELLHGITFANVWCALVEHGKRLAPTDLQPQMQMLITTTYCQVAQSIGSIVWGQMVTHYGFRGALCVNIILVPLWILLWRGCSGYDRGLAGEGHLSTAKDD